MKLSLVAILLSAVTAFGATKRISELDISTTPGTNTLINGIEIAGSSTNNVNWYLETLIRAAITNTAKLNWTLSGGKLVGWPTNIAAAEISASANILATQLESAVIVSTEIDSIAELEAILGGINVIVSTEIDTLAELETLMEGINIIAATEIDTEAELEAIVGGLDILFKTEIDTQVEFEAKLFVLPSGGGGGSGDDVYIADGNVTHPNFANGTNVIFVNPAGTNVYAFPTNIVNSMVSASAAISATKLESVVIVSTEIDTLAELEVIMSSINIIASTEIDTIAEIEALAAGINIIVSTEIDTLAELETIMGGINILAETEIDASSELRALMDDESGTGALLFQGGDGATLTVDASGFNGNLLTTDNTLQEIAQKLDDLSTAGASGWTISGTTNSTLPGIAFAHGFQATNGYVVVSGTAESYIEIQENAAPAAGASGYTRVYVKTDGLVYGKDDAGVETLLSNLSESEMEALLDLPQLQGTLGTSQADAAFILVTEIDTIAEIESILSGVNVIINTEIDTLAELETLMGSINIIAATEIDTLAELETIMGSINILAETEIDASSELRALMDDESGTGVLLFADGNIGAATATTPSANDNDTSAATTAYVQTELTAYASDTVVFTGKTFDSDGTGNVLKQPVYLNLQRPDYGDGVGAIPQTNTYTASGLMHYTFSGNAETNANYVVYEFDCPPDLDTTVAMTARFAFISGGTDADDYVFHITYNQVAAGSAYPTAGSSVVTLPIGITVTPTTAASGDLQYSSAVTLTGWAAALTPGRAMQVRVARLQNSQDDSARDVQLVIAYGSTK